MNEGSPKNSRKQGLRSEPERDAALINHQSSIINPQFKASFSGWPMIVGWLAMLIFAFHACTHMVAAGDTWVAMACGRHFVQHGVNTVEPFSANSHKAGPTPEEVETWPGWAQWITKTVGLDTVKKWHPTGWINQNWLTHVMFYKLTTMFGSDDKPYFDALVYWKFANYILVLACLYFTSRLLGVNRLLAVVFACAAMYVGRSFLDVRPAGFSNLMVPTFILVLALTSYRNSLYIWLIVPLIVFWSNVHGGYIYAFLILIPFVAWHAIMNLPKRWMISTYSILMWAVMCLLANHLLKSEFLKAKPIREDWVLYVFVLAAVGSVLLTLSRSMNEKGSVVAHTATSFILFLVYLVGRFIPQVPSGLSRYGEDVFWAEIRSSALAYAGIFALAMILGLTVASSKGQIVRVMKPRAILHTMAASVAAFIGMVIFNPFHLTNLTHTFVISVSSAAERWRDVHEWHQAFDWTNPVGTAVPFLVMYIFALCCLVIWAIAVIQAPRIMSQPTRKKKVAGSEYEWPKIDIVLLAIGAMTIYMAIRSRRFIPIAAYAACPVIALLVQESISRVVAVVAFWRQRKLDWGALLEAASEAAVLGMAAALAVMALWYWIVHRWLYTQPVPGHPELQQPLLRFLIPWVILSVAAFWTLVAFYLVYRWREKPQDSSFDLGAYVKPAVFVALLLLCGSAAGFGGSVGWGFKKVYLDYWPADPVLTSVFMRMTASDAKPFSACQFIRDNKLSGNMFNYWTEGGFIAWGQTPDPCTGRTPLQLFMDGRAQAAYDRTIFDRWSDIIAGGPVVLKAPRDNEGRPMLATKDYVQAAQWISDELRKHNVWTVLMPSGQFDTPFVGALEVGPNWRVVFTNNKEKLFVDLKTEPGRQLCEDMMAGKLIYPDEFSADLAIGHNLLASSVPEQRKQGIDLAIKAFELDRSPAPVIDMLLAARRYPDLAVQVDQACLDFATEFEKNKAKYAGHDGYNLRIEAARLCLVRLREVAEARGDKALVNSLDDRMTQYILERNYISDTKRW
jgi:hypothetical protein